MGEIYDRLKKIANDPEADKGKTYSEHLRDMAKNMPQRDDSTSSQPPSTSQKPKFEVPELGVIPGVGFQVGEDKDVTLSREERVKLNQFTYEQEKAAGYREATFRDVLRGFRRGYLQAEYGDQSFNEMMGMKNNAQYYGEQLNKDEFKYTTKNPILKALGFTAEQLGQYAAMLLDPSTATITAAGAIMGAAAGAPALGVGAIPGGIGGGAAGLAAAMANQALRIEGGLAYVEMLEYGVDEKTAGAIALFVGGINATLELAQLKNVTKAYKALAANKATATGAKKLALLAAEYGIDVAKETGQEVAQEGITTAGSNLGRSLSGLETDTWGDVGQRLGATAVESALGFGTMKAPAFGAGVYQNTRNRKKYKPLGFLDANDKSMTSEEIIQAIMEATQEEDTGVSFTQEPTQPNSEYEAWWDDTLTERDSRKPYEQWWEDELALTEGELNRPAAAQQTEAPKSIYEPPKSKNFSELTSEITELKKQKADYINRVNNDATLTPEQKQQKIDSVIKRYSEVVGRLLNPSQDNIYATDMEGLETESVSKTPTEEYLGQTVVEEPAQGPVGSAYATPTDEYLSAGELKGINIEPTNYDDAQSRIDDMESSLADKYGIDEVIKAETTPNYVTNSPNGLSQSELDDLNNLYAQRDAFEEADKNREITGVISRINFNKINMNSEWGVSEDDVINFLQKAYRDNQLENIFDGRRPLSERELIEYIYNSLIQSTKAPIEFWGDLDLALEEVSKPFGNSVFGQSIKPFLEQVKEIAKAMKGEDSHSAPTENYIYELNAPPINDRLDSLVNDKPIKTPKASDKDFVSNLGTTESEQISSLRSIFENTLVDIRADKSLSRAARNKKINRLSNRYNDLLAIVKNMQPGDQDAVADQIIDWAYGSQNETENYARNSQRTAMAEPVVETPAMEPATDPITEPIVEPIAELENVVAQTKAIPSQTGKRKMAIYDNSLPKAAEAGVEGAQRLIDATPDKLQKYIPESMDETAVKAWEWIMAKGPREALEYLSNKKKQLTPIEHEAAQELVAALCRTKSQSDLLDARDLTLKLAQNSVEMGRALNYLKNLQKNTPEGYLIIAEKIAKENRQTITNEEAMEIAFLGKLSMTNNLTPELLSEVPDGLRFWLKTLQKWESKGTISIADAASGKFAAILGSKTKSTFREKFRALQRLSMLSNPKTFVRNVGGNVLLHIGETASHPFAYITDLVLRQITGESTVGSGGSAARIKGMKTGAMIPIAEQDLDIDVIGSKYWENITGKSNPFGTNRGKTFNENTSSAVLNELAYWGNKGDQAITFLLKIGDEPFKNGQYESVLAQLVKANPDLVAKNGGKPTAEMKETAYLSALRRTFQDDNKISETLQNTRNAIGVTGDIIAPYVKTPANVIKISAEYSPLGLVEAVSKVFFGKNSLLALRKSGKSTMALQRDIAELFGRGLVGTGLIMLGGLLKSLGFMTGDRKDNEKEREWEKAKGATPNSFVVGDTYVDASSLQVLATPLIAGASDWDNKADAMSNLLVAMVNMGDTALEMPVLQGVQELLGGHYQDESILLGLLSLSADAVSQVVPGGSFMRQIASYSDESKRSLQSTESDVDAIAERFINSMKNLTPEGRESLPEVSDVLGNSVKNYESKDTPERLWNVFLNPTNTSKKFSDEVTQEIDRLYEATGDRSLLPTVTNEIGDLELSQSEEEEYQKLTGLSFHQGMKDLLAKTDYKDLSEEEQANLVRNIIEYAGIEARETMYKSKDQVYDNDSTVSLHKINQIEKTGLTKAEVIFYKEAMEDMDEDEKQDFLYNLGDTLTPKQKKALEDAYVSDWRMTPNERDAEYGRGEEAYILSTLSSKAPAVWQKVKNYGMDMTINEFKKYFPIASRTSVSKSVRINDLQDAGLSAKDAEIMYKLTNTKFQ